MGHRNLLIIMSDEHRKDAMGCVGHGIVKTPNLDRLARQGTVFENAYTPSPMCVPTRASVACGDHVHKIGFWDSATPYDGSRESWMHRVRQRGVPVTSIGKLHYRSSDDDNGFSEEILPMHVVGGVGWAIGLLRSNPPAYTAAAELAGDVGTGQSSYTNYDLEITAAAETWLKDPGRKQGPWVAFVSLVSPHYPLKAPEPFYRLYDPAKIDLPVRPGDGLTHPELEKVRGFFDYDRHFDPQKRRMARCAYYGLVSFMDDCVGRIVTALQASGQYDNTNILYVSDHGDMLGDQGMWTKQVMYEASAGVPMIGSGPDFPQGKRIRTGTTLLDIAPTTMAVVGEDPTSYPGQSLFDVAVQPDNPDRTIFSEYHDGGSSTATFMVRWDRWKLVYYVGQRPQLFDLETDPHELSDLALEASGNPHLADMLKEGEARLRAICDPEAVNRRCFEDQRRRIEALGGEAACANSYVFNHTPTPNEDAG